MNNHELRLECLRLAHEHSGSTTTVVERARAYADFVLGTKDAEIVKAATELAGKVNPT